MKTAILFVLALFLAVAYSENCENKYQCIDVGCSHHTTTICENHICTCSRIQENYRCQSVGDCERHTGICNTEWLCPNKMCRCK